jgi:hypothetical protein
VVWSAADSWPSVPGGIPIWVSIFQRQRPRLPGGRHGAGRGWQNGVVSCGEYISMLHIVSREKCRPMRQCESRKSASSAESVGRYWLRGSGNALFLAKKGLGMRADIRSPLDPALEDTPATHGPKRKTHPHPCPAPLCSRPSQAPISLTPPLQRGVGVRRAAPAVLTAFHPRGKPLKRLQRPRRFYTPG